MGTGSWNGYRKLEWVQENGIGTGIGLDMEMEWEQEMERVQEG